jgi:lipoyl(octanoyl) transferase
MTQECKTCWVVDLGLVPYGEGLELQRRLVAARKASEIPDVLLLCQHPHVITMGRSGKRENLLSSEPALRQMGVTFCETDRGGDVTYHGPGQLVGYPILNLAGIRRDVVWYVRQLEEAMIGATLDFGIAAVRIPGKTGVWVEASGGAPRKLAAIGVHLSRWVTSHGFAYNVSTDLRYFDLIVPCGIPDCRAVSLEQLLGRTIEVREAATRIAARFAQVFGLRADTVTREALVERLTERLSGRAAAVPA